MMRILFTGGTRFIVKQFRVQWRVPWGEAAIEGHTIAAGSSTWTCKPLHPLYTVFDVFEQK